MDGFNLPSIPGHTLHPDVKREDIKAEEVVATWLKNLSTRINEASFGDLSELFLDDCWWRDIVALNWDFASKHGQETISSLLATAKNHLQNVQPIAYGGLKSVLVEFAGMIWIQGGFTFDNGVGTGRGLVRLLNIGPTEWKAWIVFTQLEELNYQKDLVAQKNLNPGAAAAAATNAPSTSAQAEPLANGHSQEKTDEGSFQVLIVGAGQAGLALAARLSHMGISTRLVDRHARFGDSWRARYKSVTLNTPTYTDHPPFTKIPETWPRWLPGSTVADHLEHYGQLMGLDCIFNGDVTEIKYDDSSRRYKVQVNCGEWTTTLQPRHVVLATGVFGEKPIIPTISGQDRFRGKVYHATEHTSAADVQDLSKKKVVIIGPGTSGHDIAQDYVNHGAEEVSIIQRHPIFYLSSKSSETVQLALWNMDGISTDEADILGNSVPLAVIRTMSIGMTHAMTDIDKTMIEGLNKAGLALKTGKDGYGVADYQLIKGGHFYIDQGASQMIVDGRIKVHRCEEGVQDFQVDGITLANGTKLEADIVVFATGHHNSLTTVERLMGKEVSDKMPKDFGLLDAENERSGWWRPTGQPGLWYMTGSFMWCRQFSLPLALQIAAIEKDLNTSHYSNERIELYGVNGTQNTAETKDEGKWPQATA